MNQGKQTETLSQSMMEERKAYIKSHAQLLAIQCDLRFKVNWFSNLL